MQFQDFVYQLLQCFKPCISFSRRPKTLGIHQLTIFITIVEFLTSWPWRFLHIYIKEDISCTNYPPLNKTNLTNLSSKSSTKFLGCIYRSTNDNLYKAFCNSLSSIIVSLTSDWPCVDMVFLSYFNVYKKIGWGSQRLSVRIELLNHLPSATFLQIWTLTFHPVPYQTLIYVPLGRSDHGLSLFHIP